MFTLKPVQLADILDMALVAVLIYAMLIWFKRTKTAFVAMGLLVFMGVYTFARAAGMYMTVWIFQGFFAVFIIAILIIFQEELRSIFERIAVWSLARKPRAETAPEQVEILVRSLGDLARDKIGALLVVRGLDPLDRHIEGGWDLHGELSEALIKSIFDSHSLGHDGALVIEGGRVLSFGTHLPLSKDFSKITNLGTRHTAALGLAERTDALCLVVSEERGTISVARRGELRVTENLHELQAEIERFFRETAPPERTLGGFFQRNAGEKALALAMSVLLWLFFIGIRI